MVRITNNATFLDCSTQVGSSMVIVMMKLMNPYIDDNFALTYTANATSVISECESGRYSSLGSKFL